MKKDYRVLICGSRHWKHPKAVTDVLDALLLAHGDRLVVVEGTAQGADWAAHQWSLDHGLNTSHRRHRCFPVNWAQARRGGGNWKLAGPNRNARMAATVPHMVVAFHETLVTASGGTSDMLMKARQCGIPAMLFTDGNGTPGHVPTLEEFSEYRRRTSERMLLAHRAPLVHRTPPYKSSAP